VIGLLAFFLIRRRRPKNQVPPPIEMSTESQSTPQRYVGLPAERGMAELDSNSPGKYELDSDNLR
jgi:hypothetical protein